MQRFALVSPVCLCALVSLILAAPVSAQYPGKNPDRSVDTPHTALTRLQSKAPGHSAIVTMNDGTLRGGWVVSVSDSHLNLEKQGESAALALSDIATVRVKRSDRTLIYGVLGYLVTATVAAVVTDHDGDHTSKDMIVVFGVGGIPGFLLGALIGERCSGDIEIVP